MNELKPIVIGWVTHPRPSYEGDVTARQKFLDQLRQLFPEFLWRLEPLELPQSLTAPAIEAVEACEILQRLRDQYRWDMTFGFLRITEANQTRKRPLAVASSPLDVAVIAEDLFSVQLDATIYSSRVLHLLLHLFGHLNGLSVEGHTAANLMADIQHFQDLDANKTFSSEQMDRIRANLESIADPRMEELGLNKRGKMLSFYTRSVFTNLHEIFDSLLKAKFWRFPLRLSRLLTAAISSLFILLMTAEAWDVGVNLPWATALGSIIAGVIGPFFFVLFQQNLLLKKEPHRMTEQAVTSQVSTSLTVFLGMLVTGLLLMTIALSLSYGLFPTRVVERWLADSGTDLSWQAYLKLSCFITSIGMVVGALGASFETRTYFRKVVLIDRDIHIRSYDIR
jgi:hypothetical protein